MDHPWKLLSSNDSNHFVLINRNLVSEWELLPYAEWKFKPICTLLPEPSSQKDYATLHSNGNAFALAHTCAHACEEKNNGVPLDTAFLQQRVFVESLKGGSRVLCRCKAQPDMGFAFQKKLVCLQYEGSGSPTSS